jgi:hypothetical protein
MAITSERKVPKIKYLDKSVNDLAVIQILEGKYKDIQYTYGTVKPLDEDAVLKFSYDLIKGEVKDKDDFHNTIGDILVNIIMRDDEDRTTNT